MIKEITIYTLVIITVLAILAITISKDNSYQYQDGMIAEHKLLYPNTK